LTKQTHSEVTAAAIKQAINIVDYEAGVLRLNAMQNMKARTTATSSAARQHRSRQGSDSSVGLTWPDGQHLNPADAVPSTSPVTVK
jgi:hypothetical protein